MIYTVGDCTMQALEGRESWDRARTFRMCVYGGLWLSPFLHVWYGSLDRVVSGTGLVQMAKKLAVDQTFAAGLNMFAFYSITGLLEGRDVGQVKERLEEKWWPTMLSLWTVWPFVQIVNFTLVPLHRRVLVVNLVGVGWSTYLSFIGNGPAIRQSC